MSKPGTGAPKEPRAMNEPTQGMGTAHRTSPSSSTPPSRSGAGAGSVVMASSKAASLARWMPPICSPSTCPISGWAMAATLAKTNGIVNPRR
jgi:hypothetical protein